MQLSGARRFTRPNKWNRQAQPSFRAAPDVPSAWLPGEPINPLPLVPVMADGRLDVRTLVATQRLPANGSSPSDGPLILVVRQDLAVPGCKSVFGYAQPAKGVAIVSTFRLQHPDPAILQQRLSKVIAHEWMHLRGRHHCKEPGCLMQAVRTVEELDARGEVLCLCCRRARSWKGAVIAAGIAIALSLALDLTVSALDTKSRPFQSRADDGENRVLFRDTVLLRLPPSDTDAPQQTAQQIAQQLNALFLEIDPAPLRVAVSENAVEVMAAGSRLLVVTPTLADGQDPSAVAGTFLRRVQPLLEGKGSPGESCPMCHIARREQVRQAVAHPPRFWR